jgi:hypothetical protein
MNGVAQPVKAYRDQSGRDMARALLILLIPILLAGLLLKACGSSDPSVVDTAPAIADARQAALFEVREPRSLPEGWRSVQATFRRTQEGTVGTLRLGYLTPAGGQVLIVESNEEAGVLLARELGDEVRPQGELTVGGQAWSHSIVRGDERALVNTGGGRTIIVVGRASVDELTALAGSLR